MKSSKQHWPGSTACLGLLLCLGAVACAEPSLPPDQVRTANGIVVGIPTAQPGVQAFLGIPYAAPPVGPQRWAPPRPATPWEGARPASAFGDRCVQTNPFPDMLFQSSGESEDCLSLSVWTRAAGSEDAALPVMVWIHGGGFFSGAGDEKRHDGSVLGSKGVVLVHLNYRLGVLGFLAHGELTAESPHRVSGNYGLLDQIAALEWVRDNIRGFGGDPGNVTIFGESAGSFSVSALMASPLSAGLFHRAIGQSGAYLGNTSLALVTLQGAEEVGAELALEVGAGSLAELRALPAADLVAATSDRSTRFAPIVDGHVIREDPWDTFAAGAQHHVPLLAGWNSAEIKLPPPITVTELEERLQNRFPDDLEVARAAYPASDDDQAWRSAIALTSDGFIGYNTWKWIELHAATGGSGVYRYLFDQILPTSEGAPADDDPGMAHARDIEFVFHTLDSRPLARRDEDRRVADLVTEYWTSFARTGDPNGEGLPAWPKWGPDRRLMRLRADAAAEPETHRDRYELFDRIAIRRRAQGER